MQRPAVSVLTSCYNAAEYLRQAIESVLVQTFEDFEFILIDDGSTDETLDIIKEYATQDHRIVVVEKENTGLTSSLNVGINFAKGTWIARMDADDISFPDRLEKQLDHVKKYNDVVLLGTGCIEIDEAGRKIKAHMYPSRHEVLVRRWERDSATFPHSSALFRRTTVQRLGGYRTRLDGAEDRDLWLRMSDIGRAGCLDEPLIRLRKRPLSPNTRNKRLVCAYVAMVSHHLRKQGHVDPVERKDSVYLEFREWVSRRLKMEGILDKRQIKADARAEYATSKNGMLGAIRVGIRLMRSDYAGSLVWDRVFGSSLPEQLAQEWMKQPCVAS